MRRSLYSRDAYCEDDGGGLRQLSGRVGMPDTGVSSRHGRRSSLREEPRVEADYIVGSGNEQFPGLRQLSSCVDLAGAIVSSRHLRA
jgi:hypothetical protein